MSQTEQVFLVLTNWTCPYFKKMAKYDHSDLFLYLHISKINSSSLNYNSWHEKTKFEDLGLF